MGTRGFFAYRYKRLYYRQYLPQRAYPDYWGNKLARWIPREPREREDWIHATAIMLEKAELKDVKTGEVECVGEIDTQQGLNALGFNPVIGPDWTFLGPGSNIFIEWTYVIDLDNTVFTVNGSTHFKFDDMPPDLELFFYFDENLDEELLVDTRSRPELSKHLTTCVDLWPGPFFDVNKAQEEYESLEPTILSFTEWELPTWFTLSVGQKFAMQRLQMVLDKHSQTLDQGYIDRNGCSLGTICWQMTRASTHVLPICPRQDSQSYDTSLALMGLEDLGRGRVASTNPCNPCRWNPDSFRCREHPRIAGCKVAYCPILDQPAFVASEVAQIVNNIRNDKGLSNGTGIILSGRHTLAVRVEMDGSGLQVYHSPVMEVYDLEGRVSNGALLLVHFLQRDPSLCQTYDQSFPLPPEIMAQIVRYADFGTYLCLTLVSWPVRAICLAYPRIGEYTVIGQDLRHEEGNVFIVQPSADSATYSAVVKNTKSCLPIGEPCAMVWDIDIM